MAKDMTRGNLVRVLISFSIPLIISGVLQQLYNWVDAFIVGNIVGELALAAVGVTTTILNLFIFTITGFASGLSILAGQLFGNKKTDQLEKVLSTFIVVAGGIALFLSVLCMIFAAPLLTILETPADIFTIADHYLRIVIIGMPILAVYNVYAAVLRGVGDSRAPFLAVVVSSIVNVILDVLFVWLFRWGAEGAAAATVISQLFMTVFIVCYTTKRYDFLRFHFRKKLVDKSILEKGSSLGIPVAIQSCASSVGSLILQNFMNGFGTPTVAAVTTAYRIDCILLLPIINLGTGISTAVAQNTGAGDTKRAKKCLWTGNAIMVILSIILTLLIITFGADLIAMFGVTEESTRIGKAFFFAIARFYLVYGLAMSFRGYLEGMGDVLFSSICGIIAVVIRIVMSYIMKPYLGNMAIAYAEAVSWCGMLLLYIMRVVFFRYGASGRITEK